MVSVVIPTYGRPDKIKDAINCALGQTYNELEVIVVDDNGRDSDNQRKTQIVVSGIKDNRLKYYIHEFNRGGCAARNTGIRKSIGEYIAFLDDDDVWKKSYVEKQVSILKEPNVSAVYCDYYLYDGQYTYVEEHNTIYEGRVFDKFLEGWCPTSTSLVMVRKRDIIEAGMFDETLESFQDFDMWLRLSKIGEFRYCNERLLIKYMFVGEQLSVNPEKRESGYNRVCEKWESIISENEKRIFRRFKISYGESIKYNRIQYYILNNKKEHKEEIVKYILRCNNRQYRNKALKKYILPKKVDFLITRILVFFHSKKHMIKGLPRRFLDE